MDYFLRPGMRLMRRFAVAGKFVSIALVLLIPLSILAAGSITSAARHVEAISAERRGLVLVRPLSLLLTELYHWRISAVAGRPHGDLAAAVRAVDAVQRGIGEERELQAEWQRVRGQVIALSPVTSDEAAIVATRNTAALLDRVADASHLVLDAELDRSYLAIALVDRVPALLESTATATENLPVGRPAAWEAAASVRQITAPARRLTNDLGTAVAGTTWEGLDSRLRTATSSVQLALTSYNTVIAGGRPALARDAEPGRQLTSAVANLVVTLADALDHLLARRAQDLIRDSAVPLLLALSAVLAAAYLFAALARATSRDARQVLADIHSLTTGALHQTRPLDGSDEFAHMSHAAVVARDHLTSLLGTLRYQATHDELTALANRALYTEKLTEALEELPARPDRRLGVVVIDLDGFKDVNDSFGHAIGDRLLRALGARFHRAARRRDLVARLGADQFGVLILDAGDEHRTAEVIAALKASLEQPVDVDGRLLRVQASLGVALTPDGGSTATELLRNADVAMHAAKSSGTGALAVFEPAMHEATRERTELSFELVQAVERQELTVVYQPIVDLMTDTVHGVEALVRWEHPARGLVSPSVFVPLAEATGLIVPIGRWVMGEAVRQLAAWQAEFPDRQPLTMDVNLSTDQLSDPGLVEDVLSLISETGVDPQSIVLEITESALVRDLDTALRRLAQLSAMGVRLALDDFGTGYSSLSYLGRLPVTVLKIDKSFVTAIHPELEGEAADGAAASGGTLRSGEVLLRGIVSLGTGLGMQIVAEGIERPDQARRLRESGCQLGQGYLWSRPLTSGDLRAVLHRGGRLPAQALPPSPGRPATPLPRPRDGQAARHPG